MSQNAPIQQEITLASGAVGAWLRTFIRFGRPHTMIGTSLSVMGLFIIAATAAESWNLALLGWALLSCLAANIYIVGLNQLADVEIDRINKPTLPLASGAYSMTTGRRIVIGALLLALVTALSQGIFLTITVVVSLLIGTAYSLPPIRLKRFAFWAAASIFVVRGVVVNLFLFLHFQMRLAGTAVVPPHIWALTLFVLGFSLGIAWFKDIPDLDGDRRYQIYTLTVRLGPDRVFNWGRWLLTLCYGGLMAAALLGLPGVNTGFLVGSHAALLLIVWWTSRGVQPTNREAITRYYMTVWGLFFAEYIFFPIATLLV